MEDKFLEIKDGIPKAYQHELERLFTDKDSIPWFLTTETTQEGDKVEVTSVMYHSLYYYKIPGGSNSFLFNIVKPACWQIIEKAGLEFNEFLQIRAVMQFPVRTERTHNLIHTDVEERAFGYYTAVYYVNDGTDGDTVLFDETVLDVKKEEVQSRYHSFKQIARVTPEKGKTTIFQGNRYHSSTLPTKKTRFVLNFSWC